MSVDALRWAFRVEGVQDAYEAFVLVTLANFADDYGVAFPAVGTLAAQCRCSSRKVRYALSSLEESGLIMGISRRRPNGSQRSSAFVLVGFPGRKMPDRVDEHPVLAQLNLEGRMSMETNRVHDVQPAEGVDKSVDNDGADCTLCRRGVHAVLVGGAQRAGGGVHSVQPFNRHIEPSLEPPLEPARASAAHGAAVAAPAATGHGHDPAVVALLREEAGEDEVARWLDHRQALGMPQMTARSARLLAGELREIRVWGTDPDDALRLVRSRGWRSVRADWLPVGGS